MTREIRYLPSAENDLLDILAYIKRDNPPAARRFVGLIDERISALARFPQMGREPKDERLRSMGYRLLFIEDYVVAYVIDGDAIVIRRVLHGSRRYEFLIQVPAPE